MRTTRTSAASGMSRALVLALSLACTPSWALAGDCSTLAAADWLPGRWLASSARQVTREEWRVVSEQTFEGLGTSVSSSTGAETGRESLRLVAMSSAVYYVAKVAHNPYPVAFALTSCTDGRLVFENPSHDFPRRLEYRRVDDDRMTVRVSDGGDRGFTLEFARERP